MTTSIFYLVMRWHRFVLLGAILLCLIGFMCWNKWPSIRYPKDRYGHSLLHVLNAEDRNGLADVEGAKRLIERGADPNGMSEGDTPLTFACKVGLLVNQEQDSGVRFVEMLLQHGADPNMADNDGNTPLCELACKAAVYQSVLSAMRILLDYGAQVNLRNKRGYTPLMWELQFNWGGNLDSVKLLLSRGADPNAKDETGGTVLTYAVSESGLETVKVLLEHGADPNIKDNMGCSPLYYSQRWVSWLSAKRIPEEWMEGGVLKESKWNGVRWSDGCGDSGKGYGDPETLASKKRLQEQRDISALLLRYGAQEAGPTKGRWGQPLTINIASEE